MSRAGGARAIDPAIRAGIARALSEFSRNARDRGVRYAREGRVRALELGDREIRARVRGHSLYSVIWEPERDSGEWCAQCTCPVGLYCKHAFAVATVLMGGGRVADDEEDWFEDDEDDEWDDELEELALEGFTRADSPRRGSIPAPQQIRSTAKAMLGILRSKTEPWQLQPAADFLVRSSGVDIEVSDRVVDEAGLAEPDPELRCWRLAQAILRRAPSGAKLVDVLAPYRERPDLAARYLERERVALREALESWGRSSRPESKRALRLVLSLERRGFGAARAVLEARLSSPRLDDAPRSAHQLEQLRSELRSNPAILPREQAALLTLLTDWPRHVSTYDLDPSPQELHRILERAVPAGLATWSEHLDPALARLGGVTPGGAVVLSPGVVELVPDCRKSPEGVALRLVYRWEDGRSADLDQVIQIRATHEAWRGAEPSLVVAGGEIVPVASEPPEQMIARFRTAGELPLTEEERTPLLLRLACRWPHLRETLAAHTEIVAVAPVVALDLREDDWLQVRVLAPCEQKPPPGGEAAQALPIFEYDAGVEAWREAAADRLPPAIRDALRLGPHARSGAPLAPIAAEPTSEHASHDATDGEARAAASPERPPPVEVWTRAPDPAAVAATVDWLATLGATPGGKRGPAGAEPPWPDRDVGLWLRLSQKRISDFFEAWLARPAGTTFLGNERARRLLDPRARAFPKLRIVASGVDLLGISANWESEGAALTPEEIAALRRATTRFVRLPSGWVRRETASQDATERALADLGVEVGGGEQSVSLWQLASARPESLALLEELGADEETLRAVAELRRRIAGFRGLPRVRVPRTVRAELRPYQRDGLDFLAHASELGTGAILADDMGLGKTVQALAWLEHLRRKEPDGGPSLVVCPASVVHNWRREAERFVPHLRVLVLERGGERHAMRRSVAEHDLVITNYALLRRDAEHWQQTELRAAILDEAQNIKNPDAAVTHSVLGLKARHRIALTGTPLENRPLDLWSILSFVCPGYLGNRAQFSASFDRPDLPPHRRQLLAARLRPLLLRRLKRDVAQDLPERIEERRDCELTTGQRRLYLAELARCRDLVGRLEQEQDGLERNRIVILAALTRLRQVCCHPALAGGKPALGSGKFHALFELLEPLLAEGHKVLLFSQFVECLKLLDRELGTRRIARFLLTGQTVARDRVIAGFTEHDGPAVFLLSLKAGGTGLNLTAASYVVLFDPWWNPAVEAQAIDRSHRIGQDRTVIAYRLLARGTIEEKIAELQERKAALVRDILGDGSAGRALSREDLQYLLSSDEIPDRAV